MVSAVICPVAFANMIGKGSIGYGVDVAFISMSALVTIGAVVPACPAGVRFKCVAVHGIRALVRLVMLNIVKHLFREAFWYRKYVSIDSSPPTGGSE
jgi:hypothetical protein